MEGIEVGDLLGDDVDVDTIGKSASQEKLIEYRETAYARYESILDFHFTKSDLLTLSSHERLES
jgi:hypothetical protein